MTSPEILFPKLCILEKPRNYTRWKLFIEGEPSVPSEPEIVIFKRKTAMLVVLIEDVGLFPTLHSDIAFQNNDSKVNIH